MREMMLGVVVLLVGAILATYFMFTPAFTSAPTPVPAQTARTLDIPAFFAAVSEDDVERVKGFVRRFPDAIRARGDEGETALHHATSVEMAQLLIESGADVAARDRAYGASAARWARGQWHTEVAELLEHLDPLDDDLVYQVAAGKDAEVRRLLLAEPAKLDQRTGPQEVLGSDRHLLHIAATYGQADVAKALLEAGADVNVDGGWANSQPLENAAWAGFADTVKVLVDAGADLEARDAHSNHTALWYGAVTGREEVVRILLDAGAKVEDGLADAVRAAAQEPYPGRDLPQQAAYLRVAAMLEEK